MLALISFQFSHAFIFNQREEKEILLKHNLVRSDRILQAIKLCARHIFPEPSGE